METQTEMAVETVEELERQYATLKQRIAALVEHDADPDEVASLLREKSELSSRIEAAKAQELRAEQQRERRGREKAESDFPQVLAECKAQRAALLEHVRGACIAWGSHRTLLSRLYELSNKLAHPDAGPLLHFQNEAHRLELGDALQQSVADLKPDMGAGWQLSFPVAPKYFKFQNER